MKIEIIEKIILEESYLHPKSELEDYYKILFQEYFGPDHFLGNIKSVESKILQEIQDAFRFETEPYQKIDSYYRINLRLIKDNAIKLENFANAFVNSSLLNQKEWEKSWFETWKIAMEILEKDRVKCDNFKLSAEMIKNRLEKMETPSFHHSESYKKIYHPHYRIIHKRYLKNLEIES